LGRAASIASARARTVLGSAPTPTAAAGDAVALVEQGEQQVRRRDLGVALGGGGADSRRDGFLALGGQTVGVHGRLLSLVRVCPGQHRQG
jgi:hypothetical protein